MIKEGSATGVQIGLLSAVDPDQGDSFRYELLDNASGRFALSGRAIVVADGRGIDYETAHSYAIKVKVTDFAKSFGDQGPVDHRQG